LSCKGCLIRTTLCHDIAAHVETRTKTYWHATRVQCHVTISFLPPLRLTHVDKTMSRKQIVVRAVFPLFQNAAMRDNICRDRIMITAFPDYTMRSRLHHRFVLLCQCSPAYTMRSAPLCASSPPSTPREVRYHPRHGSVACSPAAAISSRDRSKPRKPTTF
jgi:hypothetical protein